jgi:hypothetical protein
MANKAAVGSMSEWSGVLKDFFRQIHDGSHTLESVIAFNEHRNMFAGPDVMFLVQAQQNFYVEHLSLGLDFSQVPIPPHHPGLDRLLIIPRGLTPNRAIVEYNHHSIKCWQYAEDLDGVLDWDKEERTAKDGHYAIWVRDRQEADEELKNLSANQIAERHITTETLTERLVHGLIYFIETGHHLDETNITLCTGSRHQSGSVPSVRWHRLDSEVGVGWCGPVYSSVRLRSRQVVSF